MFWGMALTIGVFMATANNYYRQGASSGEGE